MANTKQPELKEPGPSDDQLVDYKKSHVGHFSLLCLTNRIGGDFLRRIENGTVDHELRSSVG